jgi:hypothetical protein
MMLLFADGSHGSDDDVVGEIIVIVRHASLSYTLLHYYL